MPVDPVPMVVKFTAIFEPNLEGIELFLTEVEAPQAFDGLLDELLETCLLYTSRCV